MFSPRYRTACSVVLAAAVLAVPGAATEHNQPELRPGGDPAAVGIQDQVHDEALRKGAATAATDGAVPTADPDPEGGEVAPLSGVALAPEALRGWTVVDEDRRELGTVTEVIVDPRSSEVKDLVVSGSATGEEFTLPAHAIGLVPGEDVLVASGCCRPGADD